MWYFHTLPSLSILLSHILLISHCLPFFFFFFNDTATTEIYTLSLHDALPISIGKTYSRSTRDWTNAACCCGCGRRTPPAPAPCARKEHCDAGDVSDGRGRLGNAATYCATYGRTRVGARATGTRGIERARRPRCARCPERARRAQCPGRARCARRGGPMGQRPAPR